MKQTPRPNTDRNPSELSWGQIITENAFDVDGTLPANQGISLENVDLFQGYMKVRRALEVLPLPSYPVGQGPVRSSICWEIEGREFIVIQFEFGFWYADINDELYTWKQLPRVNFHTDTVIENVTSGFERCRFSRAADKLYIFKESGNVVVEFDPRGAGLLRARTVGMGRPTITAVRDFSAPTSGLVAGDYIYAVEYVYRREIGTDAEADFLASTPQRYKLNDAEPGLARYTSPGSMAPLVDFSTFDAEADELWTHVKLYRSKRLDQATVTDEVQGTEEELYLIQILPRSYFDTNPLTFLADARNDDQLPAVEIGAEVVIYPDMDQEAIPDANIGVYHQNTMWVTQVPDDIAGATEMIYTSPTAYKYAENYHYTFRYSCDTGDGKEITDLVSLEEDLIVFKQSQTGRVPSGDPDVPYDKLDASVGVASRAFFVPKVGIVGLTNDQSDVMIFGYDLRWNGSFRGIPFSRPVRGVFKAKPPGKPGEPSFELTGVAYYEGKLLLAAGTRIWAFHVSEGLGWTHYELGYVNGLGITHLITDTLTSRCFMGFESQNTLYEQNGDRGAQEFNAEYVPWKVQTSGFQVDGGRGFVEQRYVSLMALLTQAATMDVAYTGRDNEKKTDEPFSLDPADVNPATKNVMAEYQYYAKHNYPERTRIYADRLFYTIESQGYAEIHDLKLYCFIQTGMRPPWISTKNSQDEDSGIIADLSSGQLHWQTRDDMSKDRVNPTDDSKPFQQIDFIVGRAE